MSAEGGLVAEAAAPGLWTWRVPSPDGEPLGSVYAELPGHVLLVDPVLPSGGADLERFWRHLEADLERTGRPPVVLLTGAGDARAAGAVCDRVGAEVLGPGPGGSVTRVVAAAEAPLEGLELVDCAPVLPGELVAVLPAWSALVFGEVLIGDGTGLRWGPRAAAEPAGRGGLVRRLAALGPRLALVTRGRPPTASALAALEVLAP